MTGRTPTQWIVAAVAVGGACGAVLRHLIGQAVHIAPGGFPWSTFAINVSGSGLLALLPAFAIIRRHELLPPLLGTGMLGGFTTLSAYSEETRRLLADGHDMLAAGYLLGTLATCLAAVALAERFSTGRERDELEREEGDL